jgi:hypothetical protein
VYSIHIYKLIYIYIYICVYIYHFLKLYMRENFISGLLPEMLQQFLLHTGYSTIKFNNNNNNNITYFIVKIREISPS